MKLLIIPGASDPYFNKSMQTYDLVKNEAKRRGYSEVILPNYPGQKSFKSEEKLNVKTSTPIITEKLSELEKSDVEYHIFCRSYGCQVFISSLKKLTLNMVGKAILWGPTPYHIAWKYLVEQFDEFLVEAEEKGFTFSHRLFESYSPIELSINDINNHFPIFITSGSEDIYYHQEFHLFLSSINKNTNIHFPNLISDLGHTVIEPNEEYFNLIF